MPRYISDHELDALAQQDDLTGFDEYEPGGGPVIRPLWIGVAATGMLLLVGAAWFAYERNGEGGDAPLIVASSLPIKIRPDSPGGIEIPFQDMRLYDQLDPKAEVSSENLPPRLMEAPEVADTSAMVEVPKTEEPEHTSAEDTTVPAEMAAGEPPVEEPEVIDSPLPEPALEEPQTIAQGEGESLFARPVQGSTATSGNAGGIDAPPVPPRRPGAAQTSNGTNGGYFNAGQANRANNPNRNAAADAADDGMRVIRRGAIEMPEVPLAAAQSGLRPGGALGETNDNGELVYRNAIRQETNQPAPDQPVQGEIEISMQRPDSQNSGIRATPVKPVTNANGTIEIRSPDRVPPIEIRSDDLASSNSNRLPPGGSVSASDPAPQPRLIPLPPDRPVGPVAGGEAANGSQIATLPEPTYNPGPLSEINNVAPGARAPAPVATGITRGAVRNQRAPEINAPAPTAQAPAPAPVQQKPAQVASTGGGDGWRIQLAAVRSQDAATAEWRRFQRANPDLLGNLSLKIQRVDLGSKGIYFRVQAGVLDRGAAGNVCEQLKNRGTDCLITPD